MKFFILATLFGLSLAICSHKDCTSCASDSSCFWDNGAGECKWVLFQVLSARENIILQPLSCPASLPAFQYTDDFGRNTVFPFAMASNVDGVENVATCLTGNTKNAQVLKQYTVPCDMLGSNCSATLFYHPDANAVVLAFRGSKGTAQFVIEALDLLFKSSQTAPLYNGNVFKYFSNSIQLLWAAGLGNDLSAQIQSHPNSQLWVFGHSLGGALSTLAANAAVRSGIIAKDRVIVSTMGEPRTGDYTFASEVTENLPQAYRIVHYKDIVPKMALKVALSQTNAYHNNFEVWYNNDMSGPNFAVNDRADDGSGSNVDIIGDLDSHLNYFNTDMNSYGPGPCTQS
ncbi:hypothetical protein FO519_006007 [Halicephalobus sp. NKZ332]|nr:hypothetical protein FO519_006007 [Halicephalobus sp. NKZ332]